MPCTTSTPARESLDWELNRLGSFLTMAEQWLREWRSGLGTLPRSPELRVAAIQVHGAVIELVQTIEHTGDVIDAIEVL